VIHCEGNVERRTVALVLLRFSAMRLKTRNSESLGLLCQRKISLDLQACETQRCNAERI
jgi:hypothetical protein